MGDAGLIRLRIGRPGRPLEAAMLVLAMMHGSGGAGLPGAKVNAMQRFTGWLDADLILAGHVHDSMVRIMSRIGLTLRGSPPDSSSARSA